MPVIFPYIYRGFLSYDGEQITTDLSLAVRLLDEFSGQEPIGSITVRMKDRNGKPIRNLEGYYCFNNLPAGNYTLLIESDFYQPLEQNLTLPLANKLDPSISLTLIPMVTYPLPTNTTSLRGIVTALPNKRVKDAVVVATFVLPSSDPIGTIGQTEAKKGDTTLAVNTTGSIQTNDVLMIKDSDVLKIEFSKIKTGLPQPFKLVDPLKFNHAAGTPLHIMKENESIKTKTDQNGEFALYIKKSKASFYLLKVKITHPNYQDFQKEIEMHEGHELSLGKIQLTP